MISSHRLTSAALSLFSLVAILELVSWQTEPALAYPPGAGLLSTSKDCVACHVSNGPWKDDGGTIVDILDGDTKKSLKQPDGSFVIETKRGVPRTVLTVLGRAAGDTVTSPYRNGWHYFDPKTIGSPALTRFPAGWSCNLPLSCRLVGDKLAGFENAKITFLPMILLADEKAQNSDILLQALLTRGESVKGNAKEGVISNYFERTVRLKVVD